MGKVPFTKTIGFAYSFAISDFLTLLGIVWLPTAILLAANYLVLGPYFANMGQMFGSNPDPDLVLRSMRFVWLVSLLGWIVFAMLAAGVTAEALGLRHGQKFVYFSLGGPVWRVFATYFLSFIAVMVLAILIVIAAVLVGALGGALFAVSGAGATAAGKAIGGGLLIFCVLFFAGLAFYIDVRLFSFLAPVAVAEKKVDLIRAWNLTKGNFWRLFGIWLAILIPLGIAVGLIYAIALGWQLIPPISFAHLMSLQHDPMKLQAYVDTQMRGWQSAMFSRWQENLILLVPVSIVVAALRHGLMEGAMAFAYRSIVPPEAAG